MRPGSQDRAPLVGRRAEVETLVGLLDDVDQTGSAVVVRGDPGIGKSRLVAEVVSVARDRGFSVLSTTGVECEALLAFSGLHQLLRPVKARVVELMPAQQEALDAAFGLTQGPAPDLFRIAMAALDLICEVAGDTPILLVAEDAHWLDRPTADVLAFIARRLAADPIVMLAAVRDGYPSALADVGLPELRLGALDVPAAEELLDATGIDLHLAERIQILQEAAGNPLALLELPVTVARLQRGSPERELVPLTDRLERAFSDRVASQSERARLLLLVAALNDSEDVHEVLRAGSMIAGDTLGVDLLEPAAAAAIIDLDLQTIRFRHPLIRSAVNQSASVSQRLQAHAALAEILAGQPDRRVWYRAALISGEHEDVASELEDAADRARQRGATGVAVTALRRAGALSGSATGAHRLLSAAALACELGQPEVVGPILRDVERFDLGLLERARITWIEEMATTRPLGNVTRFTELIAAAEEAGRAGDHELHVDLIWLVASRSWWVDPGPVARQILIDAAHRLGGVDAADPRMLAIHAYADPFGAAPQVLARLRATTPERRRDADVARHFGPAAVVVGAFDLAVDLLGRAVDALRDQGRLRHLPRILMLQANMAARLAEWDVALPAAAEARRLAAELADPQMIAAADTAVALVAGMRGDEQTAEEAAAQAEQTAIPVGANITIAFAQFGRVLACLGSSRYAEAYNFAKRLFDPEDAAYHPVISSWLIGDLAEAALHLGRIEEAQERVEQVEAAGGKSLGSWIVLGLDHARALLADDFEAEDRFRAALASDLSRWPFQRARTQLAYGQWLRRRRRITESRDPLRAARETFDALACGSWGDMARRELRASGESSRRRVPEARDHLTAQELQIAQLAADGLSNREIGQMLFVSPRTVSTHLYRIFPKLGISARGELTSALDPK